MVSLGKVMPLTLLMKKINFIQVEYFFLEVDAHFIPGSSGVE